MGGAAAPSMSGDVQAYSSAMAPFSAVCPNGDLANVSTIALLSLFAVSACTRAMTFCGCKTVP